MPSKCEAVDDIDAVLIEWYEWSESYRPAIGYGRADPSFRRCRSSRQWMTYDDLSNVVDSQLRAATGKAVEPIIQALALPHRIAVMTAMRNFAAGAVVFQNPRSPETQEGDYTEAKRLMFPKLIAKGLLGRREKAAH